MAVSDYDRISNYVQENLAELLALNATHLVELASAVDSKIHAIQRGDYGDPQDRESRSWLNDLRIVQLALGDDGRKLASLLEVTRNAVELKLKQLADTPSGKPAGRLLILGDADG